MPLKIVKDGIVSHTYQNPNVRYLYGSGAGADKPVANNTGGFGSGVSLNPSNTNMASGSRYGTSVSIGSGRIVIGAPYYGPGTGNNDGAFQIWTYDRTNGTTPTITNLSIANTVYHDSFPFNAANGYLGYDVAVHGGDIWVMSPQTQKVHRFDLDGNFIDQRIIPTSYIGNVAGMLSNQEFFHDTGLSGKQLLPYRDKLYIGAPGYGSTDLVGRVVIYNKNDKDRNPSVILQPQFYKTIDNPIPTTNTDTYFGSEMAITDEYLYVLDSKYIFQFTLDGEYTGRNAYAGSTMFWIHLVAADGYVLAYRNNSKYNTGSTDYLHIFNKDLITVGFGDVQLEQLQGLGIGSGKFFFCQDGGHIYQVPYGDQYVDDVGPTATARDNVFQTASKLDLSSSLDPGPVCIRDGVMVVGLPANNDAQVFAAPYVYTEEEMNYQAQIGWAVDRE